MVLFSCGDYHNKLINERTLIMEKKKKVSKILLSTVLTALLAFSVSAGTDGVVDPPVTGSASADGSGASASISVREDLKNVYVEATAGIGNTEDTLSDSDSGLKNSASASVSASKLDGYPGDPVQSSHASSALNGSTEYYEYWTK